MNERQIIRKRRNLPHWSLEGSTYFVTFRLASGMLTAAECQVVFDHLLSGNSQYYILAAAVVMPDHVHLLVSPMAPYTLSQIMKGIKGVSARKINVLRQSKGRIWQDESWDRMVRDSDEFEEKLQYMGDNPLKAELARCLEEYPYWYCNSELI